MKVVAMFCIADLPSSRYMCFEHTCKFGHGDARDDTFQLWQLLVVANLYPRWDFFADLNRVFIMTRCGHGRFLL